MKKYHTKSYTFISLFLACWLSYGTFTASSQTRSVLTIDQTKTFQKIEGFGAFNTLNGWKGKSDAYKYDLIVNDLGLSIMRFELPPSFQSAKDSSYNLNGNVFGTGDLQHAFQSVRELKKLGVKKFIASIWSPPAWMKTKNDEGKGPSTNKGGSLRSDAYADFANYCAAYCKAFKQQTGIELYALGLQNEPEFPEDYNSCVYTPVQMREALRVVGRKFKQDGIKTKIYIPEALPAQRHLPDFFNAVNEDEETRNYADIFAIHNYDTDGINVGGAGSKDWQEFARLAAGTSPAKEVWMTETSGHPNTWDGAMLLAANIYNSLEYGNLSAWLWWSIADIKSSEQFGLIIDGTPSGRYYASKQFYKFIRPGAVRIEVKSNNADLLSLGFIHSGNYQLVVVLINKGKTDQLVRVPENRGKRKIYLSTNHINCAAQNEQTQEVKLPAQSIMTVTWQ